MEILSEKKQSRLKKKLKSFLKHRKKIRDREKKISGGLFRFRPKPKNVITLKPDKVSIIFFQQKTKFHFFLGS